MPQFDEKKRSNFGTAYTVPTISVMLLGLAATLLCTPAIAEKSSVGERVFNRAQDIFDHANEVRYEHHHVPAGKQIQFNGDACVVDADCSGFVSGVLREIANKHYEAVHETQPDAPYPQAKTYAMFFKHLSADQATDGWIRESDYRQLKQGDIIAWTKGTTKKAERPHKHGNTGHVMIVAETPGEPKQTEIEGETIRYVDVPVIDASSVDHFPPEQLPPHAHQEHRDGLGKGVIRLLLGRGDRIIGYWEGTYWNEGHRELNHPSYCENVEFARLVGLSSGH